MMMMMNDGERSIRFDTSEGRFVYGPTSSQLGKALSLPRVLIKPLVKMESNPKRGRAVWSAKKAYRQPPIPEPDLLPIMNGLSYRSKNETSV
jgi:hypothetical protein